MKKRIFMATIMSLISLSLAFPNAVHAQPTDYQPTNSQPTFSQPTKPQPTFTLPPPRSVGLPRDGYIHMPYQQVVRTFNTNAQVRGLSVRLIESSDTLAGPGHAYYDTPKGIYSFIEDNKPNNKLVSISINGTVPRKQYQHKRHRPFDMITFRQYVDCMIQTLEPQLTEQERTVLLGRLGLLRFDSPLQYPPFWVKFEHNFLEYLFDCKGKDETRMVGFGFEVRGSIEPPVEVEVIPGSVKDR